jgi:hypothetical protein
MIIAYPYLPRDGEWERLASAFPADHNFVIVVNDKGIDSAPDQDTAKAKLKVLEASGACVVERIKGPSGLRSLMIWR